MKIDLWPLAAQFLAIVVTIVAPVVAAQIIDLLRKVAKKKGVDLNQARLDRLQTLIVNGLNEGAAAVSASAQGAAPVDIKNQIVVRTIAYVKAHGVDTLKALGFDPTDPKSVATLEDSIRARIETALNDPTAPTPPVISPAKPVEPAAPAN